MKRVVKKVKMKKKVQPPSGGCELKHNHAFRGVGFKNQPPSGGCELKRLGVILNPIPHRPAAFGRL